MCAMRNRSGTPSKDEYGPDSTIVYAGIICATIGAVSSAIGVTLLTALSIALALFAQAAVGFLVDPLWRLRTRTLLGGAVRQVSVGSLIVTGSVFMLSLAPVLRGANLVWLTRSCLAIVVVATLVKLRDHRRSLLSPLTNRSQAFGVLLPVSAAVFSVSELDRRLLLLVVLLLIGRLLAGRLLRMTFPAWLGMLVEFAILCVAIAAFRVAMAMARISVSPREFGLSSNDFNQWITMSWSAIDFGPHEDPFKAGTRFGYHILTNYWAGLSARTSAADIAAIVGFVGYFVFALLVVGTLFEALSRIMNSSDSKTMSACLLLAVGVTVAVPSTLELRQALSVESFTTFVSVAWGVSLLAILLDGQRSANRIQSCILGVLIGSMFFAKVTTFLALVVVLAVGFAAAFVNRRRSDQRTIFEIASVAAVVAAVTYFVVMWPARNDAIFGRVELDLSLWPRWKSYVVGDVSPWPIAIGIATVSVIVIAVGVVASLNLSNVPSAEFVLVVGTSGIMLSSGGAILHFVPVGGGEWYLLSMGFFAMFLIAAMFVTRLQCFHGTVVRFGRFAAVVAAFSFIAGAVVWRLRRTGRTQWFDLSLWMVCIAMLLLCLLVALRKRQKSDSQVGSIRYEAGVGLLCVFVLSWGFGQYIASIVRVPSSTLLAVRAGEVTWGDWVSEVVEPKFADGFLAGLSEVGRCIKASTDTTEIVGVVGRGAAAISAGSERRLFVEKEMLGLFEAEAPISVELHRRMQLLEDAAWGPDHDAAASELRSHGIALLIVLGGDDSDRSRSAYWQNRIICENQLATVVDIRDA